VSKPHLSACPACERHVRVSETTCPFCAATLSDAFRATPAPRRLATRLSRAALFALGTTGATAAALACSDDSTETSLENCCPDAYGGPPIPFDARVTAPGRADAGAGDASDTSDAADAADAADDG